MRVDIASARLLPLALGALASGCASSWADIGGTVAGADFQHPRTVLHGGDFIVLVDRPMDCTDLDWVERRYIEGTPPREGLAFTAVQLWARGGWIHGATYDLGAGLGSAPALVDGLVTDGDGLTVEPARDGSLVIDALGGDFIEGTISASFADDGIGGIFRSEYCPVLSLQTN